MVVSRVGIELIKRHEGYRDIRYRDAVGLWTIGYGHVIQRGEIFDEPMSEAEAATLLARDLARFADGVARVLRRPPAQHEFDALVSLAFNVGLGAFGSSTLLRYYNNGDVLGAADEFPRWKFAGGQELPGLVRRRADERALFLGSPRDAAA